MTRSSRKLFRVCVRAHWVRRDLWHRCYAWLRRLRTPVAAGRRRRLRLRNVRALS